VVLSIKIPIVELIIAEFVMGIRLDTVVVTNISFITEVNCFSGVAIVVKLSFLIEEMHYVLFVNLLLSVFHGFLCWISVFRDG